MVIIIAIWGSLFVLGCVSFFVIEKLDKEMRDE